VRTEPVPLLEVLTVGVGGAVAKWVLRSCLPGATADFALDVKDVIAREVPGFMQQRNVRRQFEQAAELVGSRLDGLINVEFRSLPSNEQEAAVLAVVDTLEKVVGGSVAALVEHELSASAFESHVRSQDPRAAERAGLSEQAESLYDLVLSESCSYTVEIATKLSDFNHEFSRMSLENDREIIDQVRAVMAHLPPPIVPSQWGHAPDDGRFAMKYVREVAYSLDELQLFGLDLPRGQNRYSLSVAYIPLSVSVDDGQQPTRQADEDAKLEEVSRQRAGTSGSEEEDGDAETFDVRVEEVLRESSRVLVSGGAGLGKTTLLQWLAVNAARSSFGSSLSDWNDTVPFLIKLRQFVDKPLPNPEDFPGLVAPPLAGAMPDGFVHRVMTDGRALILVDGVDELPESARGNAREWLTTLIRNFPECRYVVTSRAPALNRDWHELENFRNTQLLPMNMEDVRAFVEHWHEAAAERLPSAEAVTLRASGERFKSVIRDSFALRSLADTPLLCAMLCALNRNRPGNMPTNRMELYDKALEMLLARRDVERAVRADTVAGLGYTEQLVLLQSLALWMMNNSLIDADEASVIALVERKLPSLRPVAEAASIDVYRHLLVRSGVLRSPTAGQVDFVHRTFQEYLVARALMEDDSVGALLREAHDDQWREVVILASGHANRRQRADILVGLLDAGNERPEVRTRFFLLAIACLETARELPPEPLMQRLIGSLSEVIPPTNMREASEVAAAGALAVPELARYRSPVKTAAACIRALSLIGTDEALAAIAQFRTDGRVTIVRELVRAWGRFDAQQYMNAVMGESPLEDGYIMLRDPAYIPLLPQLSNLRRYALDAPVRTRDLTRFTGDTKLVGLDASYSPSDADLRNLRGCASLRWLWLKGLSQLETLDGLQEAAQLRILFLSFCRRLQDISAVAGLENLNWLELASTGVSHLSAIEGTRLTRLDLDRCDQLRSLDGLQGLPLQHLTSRQCRQLDDASAVIGISSLVSLDLGVSTPLPQGASLAAGSSLTTLGAAVSRELPATLHGLTALHILRVGEFLGHDSEALLACPELQMVNFTSAPNLSDISSMSELVNLTRAEFRDCPALGDLRPLLRLPSLRSISLFGDRLAIPYDRAAATRSLPADWQVGAYGDGYVRLARRV
jgi:hypothetical protein